jgi:hypothetical protein
VNRLCGSRSQHRAAIWFYFLALLFSSFPFPQAYAHALMRGMGLSEGGITDKTMASRVMLQGEGARALLDPCLLCSSSLLCSL